MDVIYHDGFLPCEMCMKVAKREVVFSHYGLQYSMYVCYDHFFDKDEMHLAIETFRERVSPKEWDKMMNMETYHNIRYKAYYDSEENILHILDMMKDEPYKSVTNGIEIILPRIREKFSLKEKHRIFLYGTDRMISEYLEVDRKFRYVPRISKRVYLPFRDEMEAFYKFN